MKEAGQETVSQIQMCHGLQCPLSAMQLLAALGESRVHGRGDLPYSEPVWVLFGGRACVAEAPVWDFLILRHFSGFSSGLLGHYVCASMRVGTLGSPASYVPIWSPPNRELLPHIATHTMSFLQTHLRVLPVWALAGTTRQRCCPLGVLFVKSMQGQ